MNIRDFFLKQQNISILILVCTAPFNKHRYIFPTELQIRHTLQVIFDHNHFPN